MLPVLAARAAAVVMVSIAAFQIALVFGAPWGVYTQGGETEGARHIWTSVRRGLLRDPARHGRCHPGAST